MRGKWHSLPRGEYLTQRPNFCLPPGELDLQVVPVSRHLGQLLLQLGEPVEPALAVPTGSHGVALALGGRVVGVPCGTGVGRLGGRAGVVAVAGGGGVGAVGGGGEGWGGMLVGRRRGGVGRGEGVLGLGVVVIQHRWGEVIQEGVGEEMICVMV